MERIKSTLEIKLNREGWKFLQNFILLNPYLLDEEPSTIKRLTLTDEKIRDIYYTLGYKKIRIEIAHDWDSNPINNERAVYVRKEKPTL